MFFWYPTKFHSGSYGPSLTINFCQSRPPLSPPLVPLQWATWTDLTPTVFLFSRSIDSMGRTKGITGDKPNNHLVLLKPVCLYLYICLAIATHCGSKLQMRFPKDTQLPLRLARLPWLAPLTRLVLLTLLATEGVAGRTSSVFHGCITPKRQGPGVFFHFHIY